MGFLDQVARQIAENSQKSDSSHTVQLLDAST